MVFNKCAAGVAIPLLPLHNLAVEHSAVPSPSSWLQHHSPGSTSVSRLFSPGHQMLPLELGQAFQHWHNTACRVLMLGSVLTPQLMKAKNFICYEILWVFFFFANRSFFFLLILTLNKSSLTFRELCSICLCVCTESICITSIPFSSKCSIAHRCALIAFRLYQVRDSKKCCYTGTCAKLPAVLLAGILPAEVVNSHPGCQIETFKGNSFSSISEKLPLWVPETEISIPNHLSSKILSIQQEAISIIHTRKITSQWYLQLLS